MQKRKEKLTLSSVGGFLEEVVYNWGCKGSDEESGERAEEKGNRVENGKM